ncbi:RHS repeat protein [Rhizobium laguerreae]|uniref:RHS repeat domain-containing protein n=1 Tax=Rhizobium laguerreae TaxID=1076926 RepID=UPI001E51725C|nr:RHS repeat domain-containing protein [Rhizobium laguerreae]UFW64310.1 RHS repeat protein [Rhizobium laguerreae]
MIANYWIKFWGCLALVTLTSILAGPAHAIVDMKGANYSDTWTDLEISMKSDRWAVERTYNSRSLFNGIFGFGWCSSWETTLKVNGTGQIKVTECGGGSETVYNAPNFDIQGEMTSQIDLISTEVRRLRPDLTEKYIENLRAELRVNDFMREEFLRRMGASYYPLFSTTYVSSDMRSSVIFNGRQFTRVQGYGRTEVFDDQGRLKRQKTSGGRWITLSYRDNKPVRVSHEDGPYLDLVYREDTAKIAKIKSSEGSEVNYVINFDDLREFTDPSGERVGYDYDSTHNLTRINFSDGSYKALTYNLEKDWVLSYRNRKGCVESYTYSLSADDPKNHFWSDVIKHCEGKTTNQSRYEFFHTFGDNGLIYLKAEKFIVNGAVTQFHFDQLGRPIEVERGDRVTFLSYDPLGRLVLVERADQVEERAYDSSCEGATFLERVRRDPVEVNSRVWIAKIKYSSLCQILRLDRSDGVHLSFSYIGTGKVKIIDENGFAATFDYSYGDPSRPSRIEINDFPPWEIRWTDQGEMELTEPTRPGADKANLALEKITGSLPLNEE